MTNAEPCGHYKDHPAHYWGPRTDRWCAGWPAPGTAEQPAPVPSDRPAIVDLVVADMMERKRVGTERYGTPLQAHNGRDALVDAYQEALDLTMYLRQAIAERDSGAATHSG